MAEALILEFKGTVEQYRAVNKVLGIDMDKGTGHYPAGLLSHTGAVGNGTLLVFEVWDSVAAQEEFMTSRLGAALAEVGVAQPHRIEWLSVVGSGPAS